MNMVCTHVLGKCKRLLIPAKLDEVVEKQELFDFHNVQSQNLTIYCRTIPAILHIKSQKTKQQTTNFYDKLFPES